MPCPRCPVSTSPPPSASAAPSGSPPSATACAFDCLLTGAEWVGAEDGAYCYQLTLRPWFELLGHRIDRLIFHEMTAPDIVAKVFAGHGRLARFEKRLTRSYPTHEYTVQSEKSDLDLCRRLMEAHGIACYFRHGRGEHTLVMADGITGYLPNTEPCCPAAGLRDIAVEELDRLLRPELLGVCPQALIGRVVTVPYRPLSARMLEAIVRLQLARIVDRAKESQRAALRIDDDVVAEIIGRCHDPQSGGRMIDRIVTQTLLPELSPNFLDAMV